jgi:hypothetical protein
MLTTRAGIQERGGCSEQTQLYPLSNERHSRDVLEPAVPAPSSSAAWGGGLHEALRRRHAVAIPCPLTARLQLLISAPAGGLGGHDLIRRGEVFAKIMASTAAPAQAAE